MIMCTLMLCACTKENEENAVLKVAVHDENYALLLSELWNETYPNQELEIEVVNEEVIENKILNQEEIEYDIYWIEDAYVSLVLNQLLELNMKTEIPINENYNYTT